MDSSHLETDLHVALEKLVAEDPAFVAAVKRPLITLVAKGDGMNSGPLDYYLNVVTRRSTVSTEALVRVNRSGASVRSILDFGCGFGRVTRWLLATFPDALLVAMDVDKRAVEAMQTIFSVEAYAIDKGGTALPQLSFDLIWVGSLFTHISAEGSLRLLQLLQGMLNSQGLLLVTTHGLHVQRRLERREKDYGVSEVAIGSLLEAFQKTEYGFVPYAYDSAYGISVCTPRKFLDIAAQASLTAICYIERGWIQHQDFVALTK